MEKRQQKIIRESQSLKSANINNKTQQTMNLYYDNAKKEFTVRETATSEIVFETYEKDNRIGWSKGSNPVIKKGNIEVIIQTNFYPKSPKREYIYANILVNGILLLPLSMACRKAVVQYHFSKHSIAFLQYGAGNNEKMVPKTIFKRGDDINWEDLLCEICKICNDYKGWIIKETKSLISSLSEHKKTDLRDIATLLELIRVYESIVPEIIPIYRKYVDLHCIKTMKGLLDYIEKGNLDNLNKKAKKEQGDTIWTYIKDFKLGT